MAEPASQHPRAKHRYALLVCVVFALTVAAFFVGRTQSPPSAAARREGERATAAGDAAPPAKPRMPATPPVRRELGAKVGDPLPPLDTPLKDAFARLQAGADAGDVASASRLVRDLIRCRRLSANESSSARGVDTLTGEKTEGMSTEQLRTYQALLDAMELRQQDVAKTQALCDGVDQDMLESLTPNVERAAELGDKAARACYLNRGPTLDTHALLDHPESLAAYRAKASSMIDAALAEGDWRVVDMLQNAYKPGAQNLLAGLVGADPVQHYRYLKLYRLGAEAFRAEQLDAGLAAAAANLTPAQVADADEWAQATLQRHFNGDSTAATPQGWDACDFVAN